MRLRRRDPDCGLRLGRGQVRPNDGVTAARQIDPELIASSFAGVVLGEAATQAAGFDANERIVLRVEIGRPAEHFDGDRVTLEALALTGQRLLGREAEELRRATGLLEASAGEDPLELLADLGWRSVPAWWRCCGSRPAALGACR